jgi:hypothetical protein
MIPKRPSTDDAKYHGMLGDYGWDYQGDLAAHEHAVAKRAVEAVHDQPCSCKYGYQQSVPEVMCARCCALRDIDASGWVP